MGLYYRRFRVMSGPALVTYLEIREYLKMALVKPPIFLKLQPKRFLYTGIQM